MAITCGLDRAHIGTICDALTAAGIDPTVWSAHAVNDKLNTDMRARGGTWPDHIANPGAFLHSRLRRLSWTPPPDAPHDTSQNAGGSAARLDPRPTHVVLTDAARARIAAAQQEIRRVLTVNAHRTRSTNTSSTSTVRSASPQRHAVPSTPRRRPDHPQVGHVTNSYTHGSGMAGSGHPRSTVSPAPPTCSPVTNHRTTATAAGPLRSSSMLINTDSTELTPPTTAPWTSPFPSGVQ
ncbi:hypothetical protein [Mycolicibacterium hodleri]|uniref:hypothetical protein n=1 Tax=Mycolicibacterium hodleri TaxID=49897 RepID=UPI0021F26A42|nr:hypothetical protein [Mycolicibacterium hodleri]